MMTQESNGTPVSLCALLSGLGHEPVSRIGNELYYRNVFSDSCGNASASLTVDGALDVWFDRTLGRGGTIADFARMYWPDVPFPDVTEKINVLCRKAAERKTLPDPSEKPLRKRKPVKIPHYQIDRTRPLGSTAEVTAFLMDSGLWEIADAHLHEVHYFVIDQKGRRKDFCAAGWQNENGGWEVRARHFGDCLGTRGMTFLPGSPNVLTVFPGYTDYLKSRSDQYVPYASVLVLNYPDFLAASMKRARRFEKVLLYADESREECGSPKKTFIGEVPQTTIVSIHP